MILLSGRREKKIQILVIFRWITFLEKQHRSYFWHVLTEGGICSNFTNTNQNLIPNLLAHTHVKHDTVLMLQTELLNEPNRATAHEMTDEQSA